MTFSIVGLTDHQCSLLDTMWAIDSMDEFDAWRDSLDTETQREVDVLQRLVILETMEELLEDTTEAKMEIQKIIQNIDKK